MCADLLELRGGVGTAKWFLGAGFLGAAPPFFSYARASTNVRLRQTPDKRSPDDDSALVTFNLSYGDFTISSPTNYMFRKTLDC